MPHLFAPDFKIPNVDQDGRVPTLNKYGKMSPVLDPATLAYLNFISEFPTSNYLDVGCAYGFSVKMALERRATRIYAIDLDKRHLDLMMAYIVQESDRARVIPIAADFPDDIFAFRQVPLGSIRGVLLARVLHFFNGPKLERAFFNLFKMLQPGGRIFINVLSPFIGTAENFLPIFKNNLRLNLRYPGECPDPKKILGDAFTSDINGLFHFFIPETLSALVTAHGFIIKHAGYAGLVYQSQSLKRDGRENVIVIAEKPLVSHL